MTPPNTSSPLNQGQQAVSEAFFKFLFTDEKEMIINGPGGVGKTFLMSHLIDVILPRYHNTCQMMGIKAEYVDVIMTATTNPAAEVLSVATSRPTSTIHSMLGLKVTDDYSSGKSLLTKSNAWSITYNSIIFIDEYSGIGHRLLSYIREGTVNCKIVYVGDYKQLLNVGDSSSCVYDLDIPKYHLTEPMRNAEQPALVELCHQLSSTVDTKVFNPIKLHPGVIELLDSNSMQQKIYETFKEQTYDARIIAYTNSRVNDYNQYIRELRKLPETLTEGELLINNRSWRRTADALSVQDEIEIIKVYPNLETHSFGSDISFEVYHVDVMKRSTGTVITNISIPVHPQYCKELIKYFGRQKNWHAYFQLKNTYPDFIQRDASTAHKAQGATYDTVFIDLGDLSTCRNSDVAARLINVAFSRAKSKIYLYGDLAEKYGGIHL